MGANDANDGISKRKQTRYAVSEDCRLRGSIMIRSSDPASANKDWPGTVVDLSAGGAHIQISLAAVAFEGDSCLLKLSHGTVKAQVWGKLAHYVCSARYSVCGVKFDANLGGTEKAYAQIFQTIVASATLKGGVVDSDMPGRYKEEYRGPGHAKLIVYRNNKPERAIVGFDYTMGRFAANLATAGANMFENKQAVTFRAAPNDSGATGAPVSGTQETEAKWEFGLAASNLPAAIPADVRKFLRLMS
jgi:hypothetical protein